MKIHDFIGFSALMPNEPTMDEIERQNELIN